MLCMHNIFREIEALVVLCSILSTFPTYSKTIVNQTSTS